MYNIHIYICVCVWKSMFNVLSHCFTTYFCRSLPLYPQPFPRRRSGRGGRRLITACYVCCRSPSSRLVRGNYPIPKWGWVKTYDWGNNKTPTSHFREPFWVPGLLSKT